MTSAEWGISMERFAHKRAEEAYRSGFVRGVPKHVAREAGRIIRLLIHARGWQDIGTINRIARFVNHPGEYGLRVEGKWFVVFEFSESFGAIELRLERR